MTHRVPVVLKVLRAIAIVGIAGAAAQLVAKRLTTGDETSDEFRLAVIVGGREFNSTATRLRSGSALAVVGGIEIDLRGATLDPGGATLELTAVMGGMDVKVPNGWVVDVETHGVGGVDTRVAEVTDARGTAPTLHVTANTWFGGVQIRDEQ